MDTKERVEELATTDDSLAVVDRWRGLTYQGKGDYQLHNYAIKATLPRVAKRLEEQGEAPEVIAGLVDRFLDAIQYGDEHTPLKTSVTGDTYQSPAQEKLNELSQHYHEMARRHTPRPGGQPHPQDALAPPQPTG